MQKYMNFIDGKWLESQSKETIKVDDPATGEIIGEISCAKKDDVDLAIDAAKNSFESRVCSKSFIICFFRNAMYIN